MNKDDPADPGLVVHVFAAATGPEAARGEQRVREIWDSLGDRLGMAVRTRGPVEVRSAPGEPLREAVLRVEHDVRCLTVTLTGGSWKELADLWAGCAGGELGAWVLGECRLFVAYGPTPPDADRTSRMLSLLPEPATAGRMTARDGVVLWEVGGEEAARSRRTFAMLAPRELEARVDAWAWTGGDGRLAPFARYLMHAAKVRHHLRLYAGGESVRAARARVDEQVDELLRMLDGDGLPSARRELAERQIAGAGLIWVVTRLREMRRSVEIARHNMRAQALDDDLTLTDWFLTRMDDELAYAEASRERAREIAAIADQVLAERMQSRAEESGRRWERFGVLSTSVVGALIMMLTAVQALGYRVPVPEPVKPVIVAGLAVTALGLTGFGVVRFGFGKRRRGR
ncbi:CATRA conflict system CASPASE/TPR repeat-associated protein [Nonomuraea sp. SBT364]|uniref:CATRA conflict system CASPASE/TPR repeat-associated protein n=1 Tax=Nonomuraea sp. SBT364 TaxID=1580530 RepID=UPI00066B4572|nr:CATRA conflict system CASPASE/TPR repeat-associated protein [Nonomuraea sp. SBT364]